MEFKDISYIIAIYQHKNISQAARSLFITQSALSQQLHKIENQLGKPLFIRSGHTMIPTDACHIIIEHGRKLLAERDMMLYAVSHQQDAPEEQISFGMSPFYSRHLTPGIMQRFQKNHPQYILRYSDKGSSHALEKDVVDGKLDCCLVPRLPVNQDLEYWPIGTEEILLAVPRDHPLNHLSLPDGSIDISLTKNEPYIMHRDLDKIAYLQDKLFADAGFTPRAVHTDTGWDIFVSYVNSGLGLALMTELIINDYHPEFTPRFYRIRNMNSSRQLALACRRGRLLTPAMQKLLEVAKEEYALQKQRIKKNKKYE